MGLAALDDEGTKFDRVLLNLSKLDICLRCELLVPGSLFPLSPSSFDVPLIEDSVVGGGRENCLGRPVLLPPIKLMFLKRASALRFEVSDRALSAGEGGASSGKSLSSIGGRQKLKSVKWAFM